MLIPAILAFALFPDLDTPPKYKAWLRDNKLWVETGAGPRRVVYDALAADPVAASPTGDRVVYGVMNTSFDAVHCGNTPQKFVVLVNSSGQIQWKTALKEACNDFTKFEWIEDRRIGVMFLPGMPIASIGCLTPAAGRYWRKTLPGSTSYGRTTAVTSRIGQSKREGVARQSARRR